MLLLSSRLATFKIIFIFILCTSVFESAFASTYYAPVIRVGAGVGDTYNVGRSNSFPINPPDFLFYKYDAKQDSQVIGLLNAFGGVEWQAASDMLIQTGVGYIGTSTMNAKGNLTQGADSASISNYTYKYEVASKQVLWETKFIFTQTETFYPYILFGLGIAFNNASNYTTSIPAYLELTREFSNNTTRSFSYEFGLGIERMLADNVRFGLGYHVTDLGKVSLGSSTVANIPVSETLSQSHVYVHEVLAQLTYVLN